MKFYAALWILLGTLVVFPRPGLSTVGGNKTIEVWGEDTRNQQVILILRNHDESDIDFDLLAYQVPTRELYVMKGFPHWYEGDDPGLKNAVEAFKKSLVPMPGVDKGEMRVSLKVNPIKEGVESPIPSEKIPYADRLVEILWDGKKVAETKVRTYRKPEVTLERKAALRSPDVKVFVIRYWGDWMETGYTIDEALFTPNVSKTISQPPALYALQVLSLKNEAAANAEKKKLEDKGFKPFVEKAKKDGQDVYRLKLGYFILKGQAEKEQAAIKKLFGHEAIVLTIAAKK